MPAYKVLRQQEYKAGDFSIVPIRMEDREEIMNWRNSQIYHLRQDKKLTAEDQDQYFAQVVQGLFDQERPKQLLFSFLEGDKAIGYGGLVHMNWIDLNAEISFIMATDLEKDHFHQHWSTYLGLIEQVTFGDLGFHKLFVYAFDLRPHLYKVLTDNAYELDARLKEHCKVKGEFKDVVIHSKWNKE